jgi:hydrogenase assembly chaperone HypC/HupF
VGEYVIVHVGFAISKVDEEEAKLTLADLAEMEELAAGQAARKNKQ